MPLLMPHSREVVVLHVCRTCEWLAHRRSTDKEDWEVTAA